MQTYGNLFHSTVFPIFCMLRQNLLLRNPDLLRLLVWVGKVTEILPHRNSGIQNSLSNVMPTPLRIGYKAPFSSLRKLPLAIFIQYFGR